MVDKITGEDFVAAKELVDDAIEVVKQRMSSPFLASVLISWPVINYRIILALIHQDDFRDKILFVESEFANHPERLFAWPLFAGILYSVAWPFIDIGFTAVRVKINHVRQRALLWLSDRQPVPIDELEGYLERQRSAVESLRSAQAKALKQEEAARKNHEAVASGLEKRLNEAILRALTGGKHPSAAALRDYLAQGYSRHTENADLRPAALEAARNMKFIDVMEEWTRRVESAEMSAAYGLKVMTAESLSGIVPEHDEAEFLEALLALQLLRKTSDPTKYAVVSGMPPGPVPIDKLKQLLTHL